MSQYALYCSARITTMFINSKSISKLKKKNCYNGENYEMMKKCFIFISMFQMKNVWLKSSLCPVAE